MIPEESRVTESIAQVPVILASSSPRRKQLLRTAGLDPRIVPSDADETSVPSLPPPDLAKLLAERKAESVSKRLLAAGENRGLVIGADTIVFVDGEVLGKPEDAGHAERMLEKLQGKEHTVYTGVCVIDLAGGGRRAACGETAVRMKPLTAARIRRYVASGEPMDKAGAYGIQGQGAMLVESIRGCYFNVVGLPLSLLDDLLAAFGVEPLSYS